MVVFMRTGHSSMPGSLISVTVFHPRLILSFGLTESSALEGSLLSDVGRGVS